jgi:hypothetical protein
MTRRSVISAPLAVPLFAVAGIAYAGPATSSASPGPAYYGRYAPLASAGIAYRRIVPISPAGAATAYALAAPRAVTPELSTRSDR